MPERTEKIFAEDELKQLGRRTLDVLKERLAAGDRDAAAKLAERMYSEFLAMHDLYRDWVTDLLSFIGRRDGDEALAQALEGGVHRYTDPLAERYSGKSPRRKLEILAAGLRGHLQAFEVAEEDDRFVVSMPVCGSGGRLVADGAYDGDNALLRIAKPQAMTFGRSDFPVYCAHCHFQNAIPVHDNGEPLFVTEPAQQLGRQPCRMIVKK